MTKHSLKLRPYLLVAMACVLAALSTGAQQKNPNILVIFGDDIGYWNISAYNKGMMGYKTPNIDRVAHEGTIFTDYYAQQSCTAGRSAFITGQSPYRTGLLKVGLPGADLGLRAADPTLADLLKSQGYSTFQLGKNHLGDRNKFLPTVHGFDEFFGNFYHLNAEKEPENVDYPNTGQLKFELRDGKPVLIKLPEVDFVNDKEGKPVSIQKFIGRRPIATFGNSDRDLQVLQWTAGGSGPSFCLYVHHDDPDCEWAHDHQSSVDRLDKGLGEARVRGWTVVSMKNDWKRIFLFRKRSCEMIPILKLVGVPLLRL